MMVNKVLKKQIIIEIFALLFLICTICYAFFAINRGRGNKVADYQGFVAVLDDSKLEDIKHLSNGEGLSQEGITYTVTNNNKDMEEYKVIIKPNITDDKVLSKVRIGVDDLYVYDFNTLEKDKDGYILIDNELEAGYTKIHSIKIWYSDDVTDNNLEFEFSLVR